MICSDHPESTHESRPERYTFASQVTPLLTQYLIECHTHVLCSLNLGGNGLTSKGAWYLSKALSQNTSLIELMLNWSIPGEDGVQSITQALQHNNHLKILYMQGCRITDRGLRHFAQTLSVNKALEVLDVSNNGQVTSEGVTVITDSLYTLKNSTLEYLYLPKRLESQINSACSLVSEARKTSKLPAMTIKGIERLFL